MVDENLIAPFPYFGGKRRATQIVWPRFGNVKNYVEPFCGSLAMMLARPLTENRLIETVNDVNGFVVNFWRSVQADPEAVTYWADWPVTEIDLEARHGWLVNRSEKLRWALQDPDYFDPKIAGWWVWGANAWIGSGWCLGEGPWIYNGVDLVNKRQLAQTHVGDAGRGINRQLPHVGNAGQGINKKLPHVGNAGRGINRQLPHVGDAGRREYILNWFTSLSARLRDVRITCGDWARVCTPVVTVRHGKTAVFLDPPYDVGATSGLYAQEGSVASEVRKWCLENTETPHLLIALCGYDGEHEMPGWTKVAGRATNGGYGNQAGNQNHKRETLWFSPQCEQIAETVARTEVPTPDAPPTEVGI